MLHSFSTPSNRRFSPFAAGLAIAVACSALSGCSHDSVEVLATQLSDADADGHTDQRVRPQ